MALERSPELRPIDVVDKCHIVTSVQNVFMHMTLETL